HPRGPVDRDAVGADALVGERVRGVRRLGGGHAGLFRDAPAQRPRAAARARGDDRDGPARGATARGGLRRETGADDDEGGTLVHRRSSTGSTPNGRAEVRPRRPSSGAGSAPTRPGLSRARTLSSARTRFMNGMSGRISMKITAIIQKSSM